MNRGEVLEEAKAAIRERLGELVTDAVEAGEMAYAAPLVSVVNLALTRTDLDLLEGILSLLMRAASVTDRQARIELVRDGAAFLLREARARRP